MALSRDGDSPPGLQEATQLATAKWEADLLDLFRNAKDRFPDVVWAPNADDDDPEGLKEEVWGHKAIVYARAPPSFQNRYFKPSGPHAATSPLPYGPHGDGHYPSESAFSLDRALLPHRTPSPSHLSHQQHQHLLEDDDDDVDNENDNHNANALIPRPSSSAHTAPAPIPDVQLGPTSLLRLTTNINAALFADELEYLYTGRSFGDTFNFLFDTASYPSSRSNGGAGLSEEEQDAVRIDKLRKDLVFMWRSRLYADVRIALTGNFSSAQGGGGGHSGGGGGGGERENTTAIFSSHRFILVSRSSYFKTALQTWNQPQKPLALTASTSQSTTASSSSHLPLTTPSLPPHLSSPETPLLTLPSPPFTPASLHFTLGFLYTGTLVFSHRTYDLSTAFSLLSSSAYLSLTSLFHEAQARLVSEMLHGLFHAYLPFNEYERVTGGRWGVGGCRCRQCARRVPRVLAYALSPEAGPDGNSLLERGARRALVGLFGEGWCTPEFVRVLTPKMREVAVRGVGKRTTVGNGSGNGNVWALLWAAEHALEKLREIESKGAAQFRGGDLGASVMGGPNAGGMGTDGWTETVRDCILQVRRGIDECLARECEACFGAFSSTASPQGDSPASDIDNATNRHEGSNGQGQDEWLELLERDAAGFDDAEKVEWVMAALLRGVKEKNAGVVYQTLVSSILLRPHPSPSYPTSPLLPATSRLRAIVENTRVELLKWIGKRWLNCRAEGAFDGLEGWAVREIGDYLEVPVEDLYSPPSYSSPSSSARNKLHPSSQLHPHAHPTNNNQPHGHGYGGGGAHGRHLRPISGHPHTSKADAESDVSSMRVSVLSRSIGPGAGGGASVSSSRRDRLTRDDGDRDRDRDRDRETSSLRQSIRRTGPGTPTASLRSVARGSVHSVLSTASGSTIPAGSNTPGSSRGGAAHPSGEGVGVGSGSGISPARRLALEVRAGRHNLSSSTSNLNASVRSSAASVRSTRSRAHDLAMKDRPDSKLTPSEAHLSRDASPETEGTERGAPSIVEPEGERRGLTVEDLMGPSDERDDEREEGDEEEEDGDVTARFSVGMSVTEDERSELGAGERDGEGGDVDEDDEGAVYDGTPDASVNGDEEDKEHESQRTPRKGTAPLAVKGKSTSSPSPSPSARRTAERDLDDRASIASTHSRTIKKTLITRASLASVASSARSGVSASTTRTGSGSGTASVHSRARTTSTADSLRSLSTVRKSTATTSTYSPARTSSSAASSAASPRATTTSTARSRLHVTTPRSPATDDSSRPTSRVSTISNTTDTGSYRTASAGGLSTPTTARSRRTSTASTVSAMSVRAGGRSNTGSPVEQRSRRISGASVSSVASSAGGRTARGGASAGKRSAPPVPATVDASKLSPAAAVASKKAAVRAASVKASTSTSSLNPSSAAPAPRKITTSVSAGGAPTSSAAVAGKKTPVPKKSGESLRASAPAKGKAMETAPPPVPKQPVAAVEKDTPPPAPEPQPATAPQVADTAKIDKEEKENQVPAPAPVAEAANTNTTLPLKITRDLKSSANSEHRKTSSSASSSSVATLRRKGSNDTIKTIKSSGLSAAQVDVFTKPRAALQPHQQQTIAPKAATTSINKILASETPQGATLEIGIPCIISSKRKRFKAYARYIGEVAGEVGPWVGVEVPMPMGDTWDRTMPPDDRQWNDGSWGGIRYFEMGHGGSEWEHGDSSMAARRRRMEMSSMGGGGSFWEREKGYLKREGDQLSIASDRMKRMRSVSPAVSDMSGTESRGLFVRPQQVLYVVDAVGADL